MPFFASYLGLVLNKSDGIPLLGLFKVFCETGTNYEISTVSSCLNVILPCALCGFQLSLSKLLEVLNCIWQSDTHYKITSLIKCNIGQV